jgi:type VI secretion system protein ImpC
MADAKSAEQQQSATTVEVGDFQSLLKKEFRPKTDRAREQVEAAVKTLAEQVLQDKDLIADDAVNSINAIIAEIDKKLTEQINLVLHHADFQQMEGSWRGLKHLVFNTESSETLKIKVLNISKKELGKTLKRYPGTSWDQSPVFKKVYEEEYGTIGGDPFGCLVGDYYFDHSPQDVELLRGIGQIAAAAHAPFIAAAAPTLM